MSKLKTPKNIIVLNVQSLNMKKMKTAGVTDYTNQTTPKHFGKIKYPSPTDLENKKVFIKHAQSKRCTCSMYE